MAQIDNLEIHITADADAAIQALNALVSALRGVSGAASGAARNAAGATTNVQNMGMVSQAAGTQVGNASRSLRGFGQAAVDAGRSAHRGASGIASFWQALKRVAYYRFIRAIIRNITQAFGEGIKNLYNWSSAVNGTFAKSMDRIATSTQYLKNSLGAMLAPLINTLAPIIDWLIDRIVEIINWINKLFSALSGSKTYTVAKKVAVKWGDAGKSAASSAKKAADDIKRTILGFDEINKLEKQNTSSSGGGSGSGNAGTDYSNMFEERQLDGWMAKLADYVAAFNAMWPAALKSLESQWEAIKKVVETVVNLTFGWLKDLVGTIISIGVVLVREGWESIKEWALGFGKAVVDLVVTLSVTAVEVWESFKKKWNEIKDRVVKFSVAIAQTAEGLWEGLKKSWNAIKSRIVKISVAIAQTAQGLWDGLKSSWNAIKNRVVKISVAIVQTAQGLWDGLKSAWNGIKDRVVKFSVAIVQTAQALWDGLKKSWNTIKDRVVKFSVAIVQTAKSLWDGLSKSWNAINGRVVKFSVAIVQTAKGLWDGLKKSWNAVSGRIVKFSVAIVQTAQGLWDGLKKSWNAVQSRVVQFSVAIVQTAQGLWDGLKQSWNAVQSRVVMFSVAITQTAQGLWDGLKSAWNDIMPRVLMFSVGIVQTAQGLWDGVKSAWENVPDKIVEFGIKIKTAVSDLWKWVTDNWDKVALGALGIAVAIATPWSSLAAALSGLWASVMASFGGALTFGVLPTFGKTDTETRMGLGTATPTEVKEYVQENIAKPISDLLSEEDYAIWVDAHPGDNMIGVSGGRYTDGGIKPDIADTDSTNYVNGEAGTGMIDTFNGFMPEIANTGLSTTVTAGLRGVWDEYGYHPIDWLGLGNLSTTITASLVIDKTPNLPTFDGGGTGKNVNRNMTKAAGGIYSNGTWSSIPQYAGGTLNAHGSLFLAGEAGPEIVGHVGGRTEVLNQSQLAAAMYSAVHSAMQGVTLDANFYGSADSGVDSESLTEMLNCMRVDADAMRQQNELLRRQNEILQQINEKNLEISTSSLNKAQTYMNRRAGTTIVPVGT